MEEGIQAHQSQGKAEVQMVQEFLVLDPKEVELEDVQIVLGHPERNTKVVANLPRN